MNKSLSKIKIIRLGYARIKKNLQNIMLTQINNLLNFSDVKLDLKNNAFDFIRLVFSLFVVFAHSRYLFGVDDILHWKEIHFDNLHAGTVGVWGFFAISGYLVTSSWQRSNGVVDFVVKRYKRIFPGFWFSILVSGLFFVPLWYFIKEKTLFNFWETNGLNLWKFLSSNLDTEIKVNSVGNVGLDSINGPWWTIHHELRAYIFLGIIGFLGFLSSTKKVIALLITIFLNLTRIIYSFNLDFAKFYDLWFGDERILLYITIFMWGVTLNLYKDFFKISWIGILISLFALVIGTTFSFLPIVMPFCFVYIVISLCFIFPVKNISLKIGDLSYGIYLYHWPVRVTLQTLGLQSQLNLWQFLALNIILVMPLALISWNFVEKRFLVRHTKLATEKPLN
jgi:peptidoglycan/LPS O-acetylase OafA/YrhL